jgi:threonine dehydrogenase-like Zn-dependent dehydrogenase
MKQLTFIKTKTLAWWDVPEPELQGPGEALVRPFIAARCDGDAFFLRHHADRMLRAAAALHVVDDTFGQARQGIFQGPFPYGHECIAEVLRVGDAVRNVAVGDVVVVPWSVCCGACGCCARGFSAHCERADTPIAAYGFGKAIGSYGGMVSDVLRVPFADAMLVRLPEGVSPISVASASDNMPDAYRAVAPALQRTPGAPVLIIGGAAKSIGLYAAGMAVALGSTRVDYVDSCNTRLRIAERLGARAIAVRASARWFTHGAPVLRGGYLVAVDASGTTSGLRYALRSLAPGGHCTALAFYVRNNTPLPLWNMYLKSATLHVGVSHPREHLPAVLELVASKRFNPMLLEPLIGNFSDAPQILLESATKVIVRREPRSAAGMG